MYAYSFPATVGMQRELLGAGDLYGWGPRREGTAGPLLGY
jgi:hypothetical protein